MGGIADELWRDPELVAIIKHDAGGDFAVLYSYTYAPMPQLSCPVTALMSVDDAAVSPQALRGSAGETCGPLDCRVVSGGHLPDSEALAAGVGNDRLRSA
jgi:surfactin synthase thioesterase subunit